MISSVFEREIIEHIPKKYKFMTRDESGFLYVYTDKPSKGYSVWISPSEEDSRFEELLLINVFESVKWEDDEPWQFRQ